MKIKFFILLFFALSGDLFGNKGTLKEVQFLIESKQYQEAYEQLRILKKGSTANDSTRAEILYQLAFINDTLISDYRTARDYYNDILKLPENANPKIRQRTLDRLNRLDLFVSASEQEDAFLLNLLKTPLALEQKVEQNSIIKSGLDFAEAHPNYYRLADIYYQLGLRCITIKQYGLAIKIFKNILSLRPAIDIYLPVTHLLKQATTKLNRILIHNLTWVILGILLLITIILFYGARPWKWLRPRHLLTGLILVLLWLAFFYLAAYFIGSTYTLAAHEIKELKLGSPAYIAADTDSPGAERIKPLFQYGLIGVLGIFIFSIGITLMKRSRIAVITTIIYGLLLFSSLSAVYYLRYCDQKSTYYNKGDSLMSYIKGQNLFQLSSPEVYVLSNPKDYANLKYYEISDKFLLDFVLKHCPLDTLLNEEIEY